MGQKFSLSKYSPDVNVFLAKYYPNFQVIKLLNNGMLSKTVLLLSDTDKNPLIMKVIFKHNYDENDKKIFEKEYENYLILQKKIFNKKVSNIVPITEMKQNNFYGMIFRQYIEFNLKERIYLMPYLTDIEKIWISFQLILAVHDLKTMEIIHGDLKPENILLTSNLSVYLSDFACYKPANIPIEDISSYTYYFGTNSTDNLKGCYLAPERFVEKGEKKIDEKNYKMDVFSLGVIIAELFVERNIFDYSSLLDYKKGKNDSMVQEILEKISVKEVKELVYLMIKINPDERIDIDDALNKFSEEICPITMKGFLLHFNAMINSSIFWRPDLIIGHLYKNWIPVWKMIYGMDASPPVLYSNLNFSIVNKIILEDPFLVNFVQSIFTKSKEGVIFLGEFKLIFYPEKGKFINEDNEDDEEEKNEINKIFLEKNNSDCVFIIINYILQSMENTKYESSNLVAMEMLKNFAYKLPDITKLQLILPYLVGNLRRESFTTKLTSINYIFEILFSLNYKELILPVTEYNFFDAYVFPALLDLYKPEKPEYILEFFSNVDKIIELEINFLNITLKSRLIRNKNRGKGKRDKTYEIFKDYDNSLEEFKKSLFNVTSDLIGKINEIDILIIVIRKLPCLLEFYGRSKTNDFSKFIINNFNKPDWVIQKEILYHIPKMVITLGESALNDYILPCMELLISNNSNELKMYELIRTIHQIIKMEYLSTKSLVSFYNKLLPFLVHPNIFIRNEMKNLSVSLFSCLDPEENFSYLFPLLSPYLSVPPIFINKDIQNNILSYLKKNVSRVIYQLELNNINYSRSKFRNYEESDKQIENENNKLLLQEENFLTLKQNMITEGIGDINYCFNGFGFNQFISLLDGYNKYSLREPIEKYIKKEIFLANYNVTKEIETKIYGKIFWLGSSIETYSFPCFKDNTSINFEADDSMLSSDLFGVTYFLKTLGVSLKLQKLNEILSMVQSENEEETLITDTDEAKNILQNYYYNRSFLSWRPQGQIITTIYDHSLSHVEKLIPLNQNSFCSFDNEGKALFWDIWKKDSDDSFIIKKIWEYAPPENKFPIKYKHTISSLDNLYFVIGSKNCLYQYNPQCKTKYSDMCSKLSESSDGSDITCIKTFGMSSLDSQKIIYCTENGCVNLCDQRMNKVALSYKIPKEKGMQTFVCRAFKKAQFFIGTLDGYILNYDLKLNSIVSECKYKDNWNNNTPILGMAKYQPTKLTEFDFNSSSNENSKYLIIWTGADEHEVGIWNYNDLNCDLLLTVNILDDNLESKPNSIDMPSIENSSTSYEDMYINNKTKTKQGELLINNYSNMKKDFEYLSKYTFLYRTNYHKKLIHSHSKEDYYLYFGQPLYKLENIFENPSTVQCVVSPFCDHFNGPHFISYDSSPYIITSGNDMTIRYWDISKDGLTNYERKSYIINAPNNLSYAHFTKSTFGKTNILQSNEAYNIKGPKTNMPGISDFQNFNGISFNSVIQNEFDKCDNDLRYGNRIADAAHSSIISDILPLCINTYEGNNVNLLISASWDGTIKIWK